MLVKYVTYMCKGVSKMFQSQFGIRSGMSTWRFYRVIQPKILVK